MNNKVYRRTLVLISTLASILIAGCTTMPPKEPFTGYVGQEKIHLKVGLNITDELLQAKKEQHGMNDTWPIPIGDSIAMNAGVLTRHVFDEVVDMRNGQLPSNEIVDAVFTPRVAYIGETVGATSFGESIIDLKVEWTLSDSNGNTIWVDTINGQSSGSTGWTSREKVLKMALEDLLLKSEQAIFSAQAIKQFAQHRQGHK